MTHRPDSLHVADDSFDGTRFRIVGPRDTGRGTLVFLHGVGMRLEFWEPQLTRFSQHYRCIAYDMLGHGHSPLPPPSPCLSDYSAQFASLIAHLRIGPVTLIGHSMGALIALDAALSYPQHVRRLVAMNGVYDRTREQKDAIARRVATLDGTVPDWTATLDRWFGEERTPEATGKKTALHALLNAIQPEGYARTYRLFASADDACKGRLSTLSMPALFLTGALDPNSTPAMSEAMARDSTNGTARILAGERHMMSFVHPPSTDLAIQDFLNDTSCTRAAGIRSFQE